MPRYATLRCCVYRHATIITPRQIWLPRHAARHVISATLPLPAADGARDALLRYDITTSDMLDI